MAGRREGGAPAPSIGEPPVIGVDGEEQRGEDTPLWGKVLMDRVLEEMLPSLTCCCLSIRKLMIH